MTDCNICCENFNRSNHKKVSCSYCDYDVCRLCTQQYLLSSREDPHCMNCKKLWNREFIDNNCTKQFRNNQLKEHRENVLFERQKILMPETQKDVIIEKEKRNVISRIAEQEKLIKDAQETLYLMRTTLYRLNNGIVENTKSSFRRKCPLEGCRGFLSSAWKCGTCEKQICSGCNELKTEEHVCNPESVKTMELLKKDSKPCPTCGEVIFKISGCSQMWCPECKCAFSWNTGRIETGHIHNPHYYDYIATNNPNRAVGREHGDIPCGGRPDIYELQRYLGIANTARDFRFRNISQDPTHRKILYIHRLIVHIENVELRWNYNYTENEDEWKNRRVRYLLNELSEDVFKIAIQRDEKKREKFRDISNIMRMFCDVGGDYLRKMIVERIEPTEIISDFETLSDYYNKIVTQISKRYSCVVPFMNKEFDTDQLIKYKV